MANYYLLICFLSTLVIHNTLFSSFETDPQGLPKHQSYDISSIDVLFILYICYVVISLSKKILHYVRSTPPLNLKTRRDPIGFPTGQTVS